MIVMKRNGQEDQYMKSKIHNAVDKAVKEVMHGGRTTPLPIPYQIALTPVTESVSVQFL